MCIKMLRPMMATVKLLGSSRYTRYNGARTGKERRVVDAERKAVKRGLGLCKVSL